MVQFYFLHSSGSIRLLVGASVLVTTLLAGTPAAQAQPTITAASPAANAQAIAGTSSVSFTFSQPLTAASAGALKVHSLQRGGLRTRGATLAVVSGNTVSFAPGTAAFKPGETVFSTVTTAAASSSGALVRSRVQQFTVAAGGTGRGTYLLGSDPTVGAGPRSVAVADVDGDGDLDLLTANNSDNTVSVRLNSGVGVFSVGSTVAVGIAPTAVAAGDVDGDGDLDLLVANSGDNTVSVRLNGGNATGGGLGTFSNGSTVAVGGFPTSVVVGDVDGDGDLDLLTANHGSSASSGNTVSVRLNGGNATGSNTGVFSSGSDTPVGTTPQVLTLGDVDGDGDLDLLSSNFATSTVSVRLNGGNALGSGLGIFSNGSDVVVGASPIGVAVGDVDGDGDLDLLCANYAGGTVSVLLNGGDATGTNTGTFSNGSTVTVGTSPINIAVADVDGDGDLDFLTASYLSTGTVSVRLNGGNASGGGLGTFSNGSTVNVGSSPFNLTTGDVDGDGDLDLLTSNNGSGTVSVRLNGGTQLAVRSAQTSTEFVVLPTLGTGAAPRYIYSGPALTAGATLSLYSLTGQRVWEQAAAGAASGGVPVAGLASGWYLVRLHTATQSFVARFFQP